MLHRLDWPCTWRPDAPTSTHTTPCTAGHFPSLSGSSLLNYPVCLCMAHVLGYMHSRLLMYAFLNIITNHDLDHHHHQQSFKLDAYRPSIVDVHAYHSNDALTDEELEGLLQRWSSKGTGRRCTHVVRLLARPQDDVNEINRLARATEKYTGLCYAHEIISQLMLRWNLAGRIHLAIVIV
jgi:hypothetical protein